MKRLSKESRVNVGRLYPVTEKGEILSLKGEEFTADEAPKRTKPHYVGGHSPARSNGGKSCRKC